MLKPSHFVHQVELRYHHFSGVEQHPRPRIGSRISTIMAASLAPGLTRKLKKVLETRTDSPDLLDSLGTLSTFYTHNTPQARRNLKSTIDQRGLAINHHFLDASLPAHQALDRVEEEVNALAESCELIAKALSSCSASTGDIISTTEKLKQELEITTQRQEIVSCFLRDYQLSNEEINALRDEELNENFFKALSHVQEIHSNCKILLRTHHQMCERAAEAHKSKGSLSRRSRTNSDLGPGNRDSLSVDALLTKNTSIIGQSVETASQIYFINCLSAIQQPLIEHEVAINYVTSLSSTIETHVRALVNKEVDTILRRCGLLSKISYIQDSRIEGQTAESSPLAEIAEFSPPAILECLRSFFGVVTGNEGSLPEFEQLQGPRLRSDVTLGVARALAEAYDLLYQAIVDPKSGYPDPKSLVRHSPDQIRTILEI